MDAAQIYPAIRDVVDRLAPEVRGRLTGGASFEALGIDSLTTMDILAQVEKDFGIEIPDGDLPMISTLDDLVDYVAEVSS